ncbi:MAG: acetyltransferase [Candidatus Marinimicrobia bacterium]|nr:acetyltransferase [Candidatus Neomarinimicrobiota bacterium]MCF7828757.1 acetyltransferase [Candidatus Neomarinimicrobiota bacterium]MCF7880674.1 acetyltransferase [Candidatus Neomarinimicrobiota bacterium]
MKDIVIIGGGGHAKVILGMLKDENGWNVLGYTDFEHHTNSLPIKYLGTDEILSELIKEFPECNAVLGIGIISPKDNQKRKNIYKNLKQHGYKFPVIKSKQAILQNDCKISDGTVIMAGAVIQPSVKIGKLAIINTNASVDHDCTIGDSVHIAPGVTVSGDVIIGKESFIGAGASIVQSVNLADECIIGAGAVVTKSITMPGKYVGVPAKLM